MGTSSSGDVNYDSDEKVSIYLLVCAQTKFKIMDG